MAVGILASHCSGLAAPMLHYVFYIASAVAAAALMMMMPPRGISSRRFGALLAALSLGAVWLWISPQMTGPTGLPVGALPYYYLFSGIAIVAAVRVITHTRPVYSALWFVMVVLASAGLFLVLGAEFMAFALIIIYAGAILVTYVFVIMLASKAGPEQDRCDQVAREPVAGVGAGFLLLALLLQVAFSEPPPRPIQNAQAKDARPVLVNRPPQRLAKRLPDGPARELADIETERLDNTEQVGIDLFRGHPLGLELAGVILLVALMGAVVIARQRVDPPDAAPA